MFKINHFVPPVVILFMLDGCGKNNNNEVENPVSSPLYGTWKTVSASVTGCIDPGQNHITSDCCAGAGLCCGTIEFTRTTMTTTGITGNSSSYTINGNTFNYSSDGGVATLFTITVDTLTLSYQQTAANGGCLIETTYVRN